MRSWTLNQLRTFVVIARVGTMGAAAIELGYTVGALSQQMQLLQHEAGAPLFIKDGRKLMLSDAGHLLLAHAKDIIAVEEKADRAMGTFTDGSNSTVRLGIFGSSALTCVAPAVARLAQDSPHLKVVLQEVDPEIAAETLETGAIDLVLSLEYSEFPPIGGPSMSRFALLTEPLVVVAHPGANFSEFQENDLQARVKEHGEDVGWLLPSTRSVFGRAAARAVASLRQSSTKSHTVTETALALALASTGHGLSVATQSMLELHQSPVQVVFTSEVERTIVLLVKTASLNRSSVRSVYDALVESSEQSSVVGRSPNAQLEGAPMSQYLPK